MAADPGQGGSSHRRCTQKSHRGGGTPVSHRSVENQNRPAPRRRARLNQLETSSRGTESRTCLKEKTLWNVGAARCLTCPECLRVRRLRLGAPFVPLPPDRIDQMVRQLPDG